MNIGKLILEIELSVDDLLKTAFPVVGRILFLATCAPGTAFRNPLSSPLGVGLIALATD